MIVLVCFISSQNNIVKTIESRREQLIPQDLFKKKKGPDYPVHFKISVFNPQRARIGFDKFLLHAAKSVDAVILLVEHQHSHLARSVENAVFAATFEVEYEERIVNFKNFFGSYFSQLFRNFFTIKTLMGDAEKEQAMMLPLRNFDAPELREMARLVREESRSNTFVIALEAQLARILKRRLPRNRSNCKTKYFIDDQGMHFVYGNEKHARYDTGAPHVAACEINGLFRFGKSIDTSRHYNASFGDGDDTYISGDFPDCHGSTKTIPKTPNQTHVNMFANDFC
ncbi:MAG: hypothetical protein ACYCQH_09290 [Acidithiobacillus ferrooxidans]|jgi:hypothetical protein|uniref:Uncharacterized protein n=1 Tax=mine drainage metagenome TaxID=410659 RepID=E6Q9U2_9ZZZZ|nr:hypothetical protein [Acidithiobacillus sp.]